jgi:YhgE/Pip-like protein
MIATLLLTTLAVMYLAGSVSPTDHMDDFPIAVVNQDAGSPADSSEPVGDQIVAGLRENLDASEFDLRELTLSEAREELRRGDLYGAIVLPEDLSAGVAALAQASVSDGEVQRPVVRVLTNPLANTGSAAIVQNVADAAMSDMSETIGSQLVTSATEGAAAKGTTISGAAKVALAEPLTLSVEPFEDVPDGTGNGISAFYYALLLTLAGFTGSLVVSSFVDAHLGHSPQEVGPIYRLGPAHPLSRFGTLLYKWAIMAGLAIVVSAAYLGVGSVVGMPIDHPWTLWLFGTLAIAAVAVVAQAVLAIFGNLGMVVNLLIFIVLAIPSAGATVALEQTPVFFQVLSAFEPMRQIYLGARSILYFDAQWDAGLGTAIGATLLAMAAGLLAGCLVTVLYDRRGLTRRT